jgi:GH24 family phage-related lysozyme (muramidase)
VEFRSDVYGKGHSFERELVPELWPMMKRWEAFRGTRYQDGIRNGQPVYSIGYGHAEYGDVPPLTIPVDMTVTEEEATEILKKDAARKAHFIDVRVKVPITTYQFSALTDLAFQYGNGRLDETQLFPLLNAGNHVDASVLMLTLNTDRSGKFLRGLAIRRACEVEMFVRQIN